MNLAGRLQAAKHRRTHIDRNLEVDRARHWVVDRGSEKLQWPTRQHCGRMSTNSPLKSEAVVGRVRGTLRQLCIDAGTAMANWEAVSEKAVAVIAKLGRVAERAQAQNLPRAVRAGVFTGKVLRSTARVRAPMYAAVPLTEGERLKPRCGSG